MNAETKIKLEINGKAMELTVKEARQVFDSLALIFGQKIVVERAIPERTIIIQQPPIQFLPIPQHPTQPFGPYEITCQSRS